MMPVSETAATIAQQPSAMAIKQALDNIDNARLKKDDILREAVEKLANMNILDELMAVHSGQKQKDDVF